MKTKHAILIVIDGFGVGAMPDYAQYNVKDALANTLQNIYSNQTSTNKLKIPNLTRLGLNHFLTSTNKNNNYSKAIYGRSALAYPGADSYFGHQEICGSIIEKPQLQKLKDVYLEITKELENHNYLVEKYFVDKDNFVLLVNKGIVIGDNIETDLGQVINLTCNFDVVPYEEELKVGQLVRNILKLPRVIVLGSHKIIMKNIYDAIEIKENGFIGVNAPKSGVYNDTYLCQHFGCPIDATEQLPYQLSLCKIPSVLIGKFGDLVANNYGESIKLVNTDEIMLKAIEKLNEYKTKNLFLGINIQETDLAGHSMDTNKYIEILNKVDKHLGKIIDMMTENDLLIICSDHGDDPTIGHTHHTREYVPILVYMPNNTTEKHLLDCQSLNDIGQSIAEYFNVKLKNGISFYKTIIS